MKEKKKPIPSKSKKKKKAQQHKKIQTVHANKLDKLEEVGQICGSIQPFKTNQEDRDSQRHMYSDVHCSTIFNSQDMETT